MRFRSLLLPLCLIVSVSSSQLRVPAWAKDAVWYQIFPERFRNGDPSNDPTPAELEFPPNRPWKVSPWTSDWYKLQPWELQHSTKFYDNVFERRYGGDLQGVIDKLDYLQSLGITAIYFNPLFEAISLHKYDASTYHHIDNNFGPDRDGDRVIIQSETEDPATWHWSAADRLFLKLIREAHTRGIRIILDGVFNHCGTRFWAFQDVIKNQQHSRYAQWFDVKKWDDPATPQNEFDYKGWWNYKGLPEFREGASGFVKPVKKYFFDITRRWMDPNGDGDPSDGIDGWRLDVANDVSHVFWREWRSVVKGINPNAYIVGEIWDDAANWLKGDEFDAVMNYRFSRAMVRYFINTDSTRYSPTAFDGELADIRKGYPGEVNYILQNLIDSHDTDRWLSMILNPNRPYDHDNGVRNNPDYRIEKPGEPEIRIMKLMALFQMTYVGAPMIYYGSEAGMWGADDPDDRKPMVWDDLTYENEASDPVPGHSRPSDPVVFNRSLFSWFQKLISIRKQHPALSRGTFNTILLDDAKGLYAFRRTLGDENIIVVTNNSPAPQQVRLGGSGLRTDLVTGKAVTLPVFELPARNGVILAPVKSANH